MGFRRLEKENMTIVRAWKRADEGTSKDQSINHSVRVVEAIDRRSRHASSGDGVVGAGANLDMRHELEQLVSKVLKAGRLNWNLDEDTEFIEELFNIISKSMTEAGIEAPNKAALIAAIDLTSHLDWTTKEVIRDAKKIADAILDRQWTCLMGDGEIPNRWSVRTESWENGDGFKKKQLREHLLKETLDEEAALYRAHFFSYDEEVPVLKTDEEIRTMLNSVSTEELASLFSASGDLKDRKVLIESFISFIKDGKESLSQTEESRETEKESLDHIARFIRTDFGGQEPRTLIEKQMREAGVEPTQAAVDFCIHKMKFTAEGIRKRINPRLKRLRSTAVERAQKAVRS